MGFFDDVGNFFEGAADTGVGLFEDGVGIVVDIVEDGGEAAGKVIEAVLDFGVDVVEEAGDTGSDLAMSTWKAMSVFPEAMEDAGIFDAIDTGTFGLVDLEFADGQFSSSFGVDGFYSAGLSFGEYGVSAGLDYAGMGYGAHITDDGAGVDLSTGLDVDGLPYAAGSINVAGDGDVAVAGEAEGYVPTPAGWVGGEVSGAYTETDDGFQVEGSVTGRYITNSGQVVGAGVHGSYGEDAEGYDANIGVHGEVGQLGGPMIKGSIDYVEGRDGDISYQGISASGEVTGPGYEAGGSVGYTNVDTPEGSYDVVSASAHGSTGGVSGQVSGTVVVGPDGEVHVSGDADLQIDPADAAAGIAAATGMADALDGAVEGAIGDALDEALDDLPAGMREVVEDAAEDALGGAAAAVEQLAPESRVVGQAEAAAETAEAPASTPLQQLFVQPVELDDVPPEELAEEATDVFDALLDAFDATITERAAAAAAAEVDDPLVSVGSATVDDESLAIDVGPSVAEDESLVIDVGPAIFEGDPAPATAAVEVGDAVIEDQSGTDDLTGTLIEDSPGTIHIGAAVTEDESGTVDEPGPEDLGFSGEASAAAGIYEDPELGTVTLGSSSFGATLDGDEFAVDVKVDAATYSTGDLLGPDLQINAHAGEVNLGLAAGEDGARGSAQADLAGIDVQFGDEQNHVKVGLSFGVGGALGHQTGGDTDGDGYEEWGVSGAGGPLSVDLKVEPGAVADKLVDAVEEDPVGMIGDLGIGLATGPLGGIVEAGQDTIEAHTEEGAALIEQAGKVLGEAEGTVGAEVVEGLGGLFVDVATTSPSASAIDAVGDTAGAAWDYVEAETGLVTQAREEIAAAKAEVDEFVDDILGDDPAPAAPDTSQEAEWRTSYQSDPEPAPPPTYDPGPEHITLVEQELAEPAPVAHFVEEVAEVTYDESTYDEPAEPVYDEPTYFEPDA